MQKTFVASGPQDSFQVLNATPEINFLHEYFIPCASGEQIQGNNVPVDLQADSLLPHLHHDMHDAMGPRDVTYCVFLPRPNLVQVALTFTVSNLLGDGEVQSPLKSVMIPCVRKVYTIVKII